MDDMRVSRIIAETILTRRGFGFYTNPMDGGQDAYDISCEALEDALAALSALSEAGWVVERVDKIDGLKHDLKRHMNISYDLLKENDKFRAMLSAAPAPK